MSVVTWAERAHAQVDAADVARAVAERLGIDASAVCVELGGPTTSADSVSFVEGAGGSWLATLFAGGRSTRRFVRARVRVPVPVAVARIERGAEITASDVRWEERCLRPGSGPGAPPSPIGGTAARFIEADEALLPPTIRPPLWVRGGERVEAVMAGPGFVLTLRAEALRSARAGDSLDVRLPSGTRMRAAVVAPRQVRLLMGDDR